jgi:hypothetical protein
MRGSAGFQARRAMRQMLQLAKIPGFDHDGDIG